MPLRLSFRSVPFAIFRPAGRALALAAGGLAFLAGPVARGDIQQPPKATGAGDREVRRQEPPATALEGRARVDLGGSVEIVLEANGGEGKTIEFIVRDAPAHGTLAGPPRQLTRTTAAVTYVHHAGDGAQGDSFTFAAQARGGRVSAAATVVIGVLDAAPDLTATPAELDFGAVRSGDTSRAEITLENRGGGVAVGQLFPPPPWRVEGPADYHLARGERRKFAVVFRPERGEVFVENWRIAGEEGRRGVRLVGTGLVAPTPAPVAVVALRRPAAPPTAVPDTSGRALASDRQSVRAEPLAMPPAIQASPPADTPGPALVVDTSVPPGDRVPLLATSAGVTAKADTEAPPANAAQVTSPEGRGTGPETAELVWAAPEPTPRSYRVEMRYLLIPPMPEDNKPGEVISPGIEWRVHRSTAIQTKAGKVTARLSGLASTTIYALRVVAVDEAGRPAEPSSTVFVQTKAASTFWRLTPLKVLSALLAVCLGFYARARWQQWQFQREAEEREQSLYSGR